MPFDEVRAGEQALERWRIAEERVWTRWDALLGAGRETRADAFAAYLTALEAEAVAAQRIADLCAPPA